MAGSKEGARKAVITTRKKHGDDHYARAGQQGGSAPYKGKKGFAAHPELASEAGVIGGRISKRLANDLWSKKVGG